VQPTKKIGVFISHRHEDRALAETVADKLNELAPGKLHVYVSFDIPASDLYRRWIEDAIAKSDIFLLLFTEEDANWSWPMFEAGLFLGKSREDSALSRLIVLRNANLETVKGPLEAYQSVAGDRQNLVSFLRHF
jgi:hypothetical protein